MSVHSIEIEVHDKAIHRIVPEGATAERVATGFGFTEGPVGGGERLDICLDFKQNEK